MENTNNNILEIKNLHTYFYTDSGVIKSVDGVDIELREGTTLGIVGESGSGKSVTALSVMGLLMGTTGKVAEGEILFEGDVYKRQIFMRIILIWTWLTGICRRQHLRCW